MVPKSIEIIALVLILVVNGDQAPINFTPCLKSVGSASILQEMCLFQRYFQVYRPNCGSSVYLWWPQSRLWSLYCLHIHPSAFLINWWCNRMRFETRLCVPAYSPMQLITWLTPDFSCVHRKHVEKRQWKESYSYMLHLTTKVTALDDFQAIRDTEVRALG